jgi:hypothetical protein
MFSVTDFLLHFFLKALFKYGKALFKPIVAVFLNPFPHFIQSFRSMRARAF